MQEQALRIGDRVRVIVTWRTPRDIPFRVAGTFRLWPGWYPDRRMTGRVRCSSVTWTISGIWRASVALSCLAEAGAGDPPCAGARRRGAAGCHPRTGGPHRGVDRVGAERPSARAVRRAVGRLCGGLAHRTGVLPAIIFSLRRRYIELGVLAAIGLATAVATLLGWEMLVLRWAPAGRRHALGVTASRLYIPFLESARRSRPARCPSASSAWCAVYDLCAVCRDVRARAGCAGYVCVQDAGVRGGQTG